MSFKAKRDQLPADTQTVARVTGALEGYLADTGPGASVSVAHVLDLLNPRGLWRFDPERRETGKPAGQAVPPSPAGRDPLTGCLPANAS